jgi:tetratricopeptide (TPR) repeat protein
MHNFWRLFSLICLLGTLFAVYRPGLYGDFEFDDQANLLQNSDLQILNFSLHGLKLAALSGDSGPLGRPISMVTFALNHILTGFDPFYLKLTNVGIHAISGIALYLLVVQLLFAYRRTHSHKMLDEAVKWIAMVVASAWMLHPLNLTSVLYIVQRMTSLAGFFSLLALYFYTLGRNRTLENKASGWWLILLASPIAGIIALFCKENSAVLPLLIFLVEWFLFKFHTTNTFEKKTLHAIFISTLWLPLFGMSAFLLLTPEWLSNGFEGRGFTLTERLMTESRVLWFYIHMIIAPDISLLGIYHDDIKISSNLLTPSSTLPAILGLLLLSLFAIGLRSRIPILSFGIVWFLAGHLMESSFVPLEIAHEHRNYLPMVGLLLAGVYYLLNSQFTRKIQRSVYLLVSILIGMLAFSTHVRATQWGDLLEHAITEAENHPSSPRAQQQLGRMYFKLYKAEKREVFYENARQAFEISSALDPDFKSGLYARIILDFNAGRPPPKSVIADFKYRLQNRRTEPGDITMFDSLLQCQLAGDCKLPDKVFLEFLEIESDRYKDSPKWQASFLSFLGAYAAQKMDDEALAERYLKQAVEVYPEDIQGRLNYAWYLGATGQFQSANEQIRYAWKINRKLNKYGKRIEDVAKSIEEKKEKMQ